LEEKLPKERQEKVEDPLLDIMAKELSQLWTTNAEKNIIFAQYGPVLFLVL